MFKVAYSSNLIIPPDTELTKLKEIKQSVMLMDCIYIAPLYKVLYNLCLSFTHSHTHTHTHTHKRQLAAMQGTNQLVRSNLGLGVLLRDTSTHPGWDRTCNPPTARQLLLPPEPYHPRVSTDSLYIVHIFYTIIT